MCDKDKKEWSMHRSNWTFRLDALLKWPCHDNWWMAVGLSRWDCGNGLINARLFEIVSGLENSSLNSTLVKPQISHRRDSGSTLERKVYPNNHSMFDHGGGEGVSLEVVFRYGSCVSVKMTSFCLNQAKQTVPCWMHITAVSQEYLHDCILTANTENGPHLLNNFLSSAFIL